MLPPMHHRFIHTAPMNQTGQKLQCHRAGAAAVPLHSKKPRITRDGHAPYNHRGTILVAGAWLALYVVAVIQHFVSRAN